MDTKASHKIPHKKPGKKKPKDKPKRPLSAYNFFFKEEREKILKVVLAEDPSKVIQDPESEDFLSDEAIVKLKKEGGKVSFEEMGKVIGQRWKNIDPDRLTKFSELATEDTERYKGEMSTYNARQESRMRAEALKPPPVYAQGGGPPAAMGYPPQGMIPPGMDPSRGAYDQYNAAMAGYYGGMDFQGYGYAAMGYGGGGYGMPPPPGPQAGGGMDPYGAYGMAGGGYSSPGMMAYGGGPPHDYGPPPHGMDPQQHQSSPGGGGPPPPHSGMYSAGYGGPSPPGGSWGGQ